MLCAGNARPTTRKILVSFTNIFFPVYQTMNHSNVQSIFVLSTVTIYSMNSQFPFYFNNFLFTVLEVFPMQKEEETIK